MNARPLVEENPSSVALLTKIFFGQSFIERDKERDKKYIVKLYKGGITEEQIIKIMGFDKKIVEQTVKNIKKKNGSKSNGIKKPSPQKD